MSTQLAEQQARISTLECSLENVEIHLARLYDATAAHDGTDWDYEEYGDQYE